MLGRLGDFASPSELAGWLAETPSGGDWSHDAAALVSQRLGASSI